ncbi:hypothetical protein J2Z40_001930 [Cytobacillus eiseniae]|uniref:Uncharacterized protein n=1 Tax=Cytobacillus eiseniae TaxID=762947 RepID=A0ABS4REN4_9BACI|nr:hypothetical protein [Cytobacillus eiseniae]MBP2241368.1 hypothetical protein [Cytobacillus eiseniae]
MTYIIENATILKDQRITKNSLLIENGRILSIKPAYKRYRYIRMNAAPYIMAPTSTLLFNEFPFNMSFQEQKKFFIDEFILKGCTTFLTLATVKQENNLLKEVKQLKTRLLNSPIDFIIGVRVAIKRLTPAFLRTCKRERIPAIFVEVSGVDELDHLPWGWLREAIFPYNSPLIPIFINQNERERKHAEVQWKRKMQEEKMPFIEQEIVEQEPISYSALTKIGIYPKVSNIHQGCELSYNLYLKSREIRKIEEVELFHYHRHMLVTTIHKGNVIRAQNQIEFRPGFGEHIPISTPSFFST